MTIIKRCDVVEGHDAIRGNKYSVHAVAVENIVTIHGHRLLTGWRQVVEQIDTLIPARAAEAILQGGHVVRGDGALRDNLQPVLKIVLKEVITCKHHSLRRGS